MKTKNILLAVGLATISSLAYGQAPTLTELEQTKLELYSAQMQLVNQQRNNLQAQIMAQINSLNAEHPGFKFNTDTGKFEPMEVKPVNKINNNNSTGQAQIPKVVTLPPVSGAKK